MSKPRNQSKDSSVPIKQQKAPEGFQVEQSGQSLRITYQERSWEDAIRSLILGGMFLLIGIPLSSYSDNPIAVQNFIGLFVVIFGLVLIYSGLIKLINHNRIEVSSNILNIHSSPLPTLFNRNVDCLQIKQLVVREKINRVGEGGVTYHLHAVLTDGRTVKLTGGFWDEDIPKFLKQLIEQRLGISSQAVNNENLITEASSNRLSQYLAPTGDIMDTQSRQLTIREYPSHFMVIGAILLIAGVLLYIFMKENKEGAIFAGVLGLLVILFSLASILTITVDKDSGLLSIKSIWKRKGIVIPLNKLRDIQVESSESDNGGTTYRLIAIKTNGDVIPFRSWYTNGLSSFKKRVAQLRNFIGISDNKS